MATGIQPVAREAPVRVSVLTWKSDDSFEAPRLNGVECGCASRRIVPKDPTRRRRDQDRHRDRVRGDEGRPSLPPVRNLDPPTPRVTPSAPPTIPSTSASISVTDTSMMFMMAIPPTTSEIAATEPRERLIVSAACSCRISVFSGIRTLKSFGRSGLRPCSSRKSSMASLTLGRSRDDGVEHRMSSNPAMPRILRCDAWATDHLLLRRYSQW
jgi:hypothetical protein